MLNTGKHIDSLMKPSIVFEANTLLGKFKRILFHVFRIALNFSCNSTIFGLFFPCGALQFLFPVSESLERLFSLFSLFS